MFGGARGGGGRGVATIGSPRLCRCLATMPMLRTIGPMSTSWLDKARDMTNGPTRVLTAISSDPGHPWHETFGVLAVVILDQDPRPEPRHCLDEAWI